MTNDIIAIASNWGARLGPQNVKKNDPEVWAQHRSPLTITYKKTA